MSDNARAMAWIDRAVGEAECVMSEGNGAFVLAKGGPLENQRATTFSWFIDELGEAEPTCTPVHDERFVDNGKILTTAGLSSGIDGALHLVERYSDHFTAEQRANACGPSSKTERLQVAVPWGRRPAMSQTGDPTGADCGAVVE